LYLATDIGIALKLIDTREQFGPYEARFAGHGFDLLRREKNWQDLLLVFV
jgi:hypothetical protein